MPVKKDKINEREKVKRYKRKGEEVTEEVKRSLRRNLVKAGDS